MIYYAVRRCLPLRWLAETRENGPWTSKNKRRRFANKSDAWDAAYNAMAEGNGRVTVVTVKIKPKKPKSTAKSGTEFDELRKAAAEVERCADWITSDSENELWRFI